MKTLIIYDSLYGDTEKIAQTIGQAIGPDARVIKVSEARVEDLENVGLFIVGSPTHGGRATPAVQNFLKSIPNGTLRNTRVAAFDTRFDDKKVNAFLRFLAKVLNFAAPKMAKDLKIKGVETVIEPMGFIIEDTKGPLKQGEIERATQWAKSLI